jgi:hypothetical protein
MIIKTIKKRQKELGKINNFRYEKKTPLILDTRN